MPQQINFFDGVESSTTPTVGNIDTSNLLSYADDAAYEADNAGSPAGGNIYYNTTLNKVRYYDAGGAAWNNLDELPASDVTYNNATSGLTATDAQAAIDELDTNTETVQSNLTSHLNDTVDAHDASAISYSNATSGLTATEMQSAIDEVEGRIDTLEAAPAGANQTLSNLTAPTAVSETLNMDATKTVIVENNVGFQGKDTGGTARNFIKMRTDNDMELGFSGANLNVQCPTILRTGGLLNLGSSPNPINELKLTNMGSQIKFNGNHANIVTDNGAATDRIQIFTGGASTTTSGKILLQSGNAQTDSGEIDIKSGAATTGNSGNLLFTTGPAGGTRGDATFDINRLNIKDNSLGAASVGYVWKLQNATTGEGAWGVDASGGSSKTVTSYSSTATASISDDVILLSGATFTLTLPTAVGNSGKVFEILHTGTSLTQIYTIDGNASETIRGNTTFAMHTNGQRLRIVSDGTNWQVLDHYTETDWIDGGTASTLIDAITTDPTPATTTLVDKVWWRRQGNSMEVRYEYKHTDNTGSAAGSGKYLFALPASQSIDTTKVTASTSTTAFDIRSNIGDGKCTASGSFAEVTANVYDSTYFRLHGVDATGYIEVSDTQYPMNNAAAGYLINIIVPVDGWEF